MGQQHSSADSFLALPPLQKDATTATATANEILRALWRHKGLPILCAGCRAIPMEVFIPSSSGSGNRNTPTQRTAKYFHYPGMDAETQLRNSAATGCQLCRLFHDALDETQSIETPPPNKGHRDRLTLSSEHISGRPSILHIKFVGDRLSLATRLGFRLVSLADGANDENTAKKPSSVATAEQHDGFLGLTETEADSPANCALVAGLLETCLKTHPVCRQTTEGMALPKRLLDVGKIPGRVRLRLSSRLSSRAGRRAEYAALSHCWGATKKMPKTCKANLASQETGFPDTLLPPTFFDAVAMTRQLGLRYLWIDSLCIVQDDNAEVEKECARMNFVYRNAVITFSASAARDCTEGLFASRKLRPLPLVWNTGDNNSERRIAAFIYPSVAREWHNEIHGPLQKRAWVLQERELSPRIVHYTERCLMWECRMAEASEYDPRMRARSEMCWKPQANTLQMTRLLDSSNAGLLPGGSPTGALRPHEYKILRHKWYAVVHRYSGRDLTVAGDRLPAMAGIAAEWKRMIPNDEYLAGLWKSDVFRGLMWSASRRQQIKKTRASQTIESWPPPSKYEGIPSWSWASYDGPVQEWQTSNKTYGHVISNSNSDVTESEFKERPIQLDAVSMTVVGCNPFGRVSEGKLSLSGWTMMVTVSSNHAQRSQGMSTWYNPIPLNTGSMVRIHLDHDHPCLPSTEFLILRLNHDSGPLLRYPVGLVLLEVDADNTIVDPDRQVYRRVGLFSIENCEKWICWREWRTVTIL